MEIYRSSYTRLRKTILLHFSPCKVISFYNWRSEIFIYISSFPLFGIEISLWIPESGWKCFMIYALQMIFRSYLTLFFGAERRVAKNLRGKKNHTSKSNLYYCFSEAKYLFFAKQLRCKQFDIIGLIQVKLCEKEETLTISV